jgi:hypothetical protein
VRLERYIKDILIELHTLREMVDTLVLPAAYDYAGRLGEAAANAKAAGIKVIPQIAAANQVGELITRLEAARTALGQANEQAEKMHDDPEKLANFLTTTGADRMAEVRKCCDALEAVVSDDLWPLPKYRETRAEAGMFDILRDPPAAAGCGAPCWSRVPARTSVCPSARRSPAPTRGVTTTALARRASRRSATRTSVACGVNIARLLRLTCKQVTPGVDNLSR